MPFVINIVFLYDKNIDMHVYTIRIKGRFIMGLLNIFKEIAAQKNQDTMRVGLSSFKTNKKTIENATAHMASISSKDVKLSDLMRRTNLY